MSTEMNSVWFFPGCLSSSPGVDLGTVAHTVDDQVWFSERDRGGEAA